MGHALALARHALSKARVLWHRHVPHVRLLHPSMLPRGFAVVVMRHTGHGLQIARKQRLVGNQQRVVKREFFFGERLQRCVVRKVSIH